MLSPLRGERLLDIGCGQGVFARLLRGKGCIVTGVDASKSLIESARVYEKEKDSKLGRIDYRCLDAASLDGLPDGQFDAASAILCIQNMGTPGSCCPASVLAFFRARGRMLWVINHPYFRIPRQSSWGFDDAKKNAVQTRGSLHESA
jgi:SAM-dependent methyltransferase